VVEDESFFVFDVKMRAVWAVKGSKPVMLTTGSHKSISWFGALADDGAQLFRQYEWADSDHFLDYMKHLHRKHPKMILFLDKATYHKKEKRVKRFFRERRKTIRLRWFPSGFPEANPLEECWRQGKDSVLGSAFHDSFEDFKKASSTYYRTRRFKLNLYKYLCH
jgi:transposase